MPNLLRWRDSLWDDLPVLSRSCGDPTPTQWDSAENLERSVDSGKREQTSTGAGESQPAGSRSRYYFLRRTPPILAAAFS